MKICHVNLARGFRGGERQTEMLIRGLSDLGVTQRLVVRQGSPLIARLDSLPGLELHPVARPFLLRVRHARGVHLVHAHEAKAVHYAHLSRLVNGVPFLLTRRVPQAPGSGALTRLAYRRASAVIAISSAIESVIRRYAPDTPLVRIPSMASHLPVDPARVREIRARFAGRQLVIHVGALVSRHKGQDVLIDAARTLNGNGIAVVLLGEGPDELALKIRAEGLDQVHFPGFVDNVGDWTAAADLFVFPSHEEGLGSSILDAMEQGKAIIASRTGGIPDLIEDGVNGLLVPPGDPDTLARAMRSLLGNPALRSRYGAAAQMRVREFQPEHVAQRVLSLYRDVLAGRSALRAPST